MDEYSELELKASKAKIHRNISGAFTAAYASLTTTIVALAVYYSPFESNVDLNLMEINTYLLVGATITLGTVAGSFRARDTYKAHQEYTSLKEELELKHPVHD